MANTRNDNILVVVKNKDDGEIVLDKANQLAQPGGSKLHVVRIIHDAFAELSIHDVEQSQELKTYLLAAEETMLEELIEPIRQSGTDVESATLWHKSEWEAILELATDINATLILKGTEHSHQEIVRTPSDWNLLRHAEVPVMLVKPVNWSQQPRILAAVDALNENEDDLNTRVLLRASQLAKRLGGELHVISVFPSVEQWTGPVTLVIDFDHVRKKIQNDISERINTLISHLGIKVDKIHTKDGVTAVMIHQATAAIGAELLVMGTNRRSGAKGVLMGNTSEKILHTVHCDVEVLH